MACVTLRCFVTLTRPVDLSDNLGPVCSPGWSSMLPCMTCAVSCCVTLRCFLTLTQALALGYGGNPYGPAGTGKTESVKALGAALGRQVRKSKRCDQHTHSLSLDLSLLAPSLLPSFSPRLAPAEGESFLPHLALTLSDTPPIGLTTPPIGLPHLV